MHRKIRYITTQERTNTIHFKIASIILDFKMESPNVGGKYTCEICEKDFSTKHSKEQHISTVHGEVKKFHCNVCEKKIWFKPGTSESY